MELPRDRLEVQVGAGGRWGTPTPGTAGDGAVWEGVGECGWRPWHGVGSTPILPGSRSPGRAGHTRPPRYIHTTRPSPPSRPAARSGPGTRTRGPGAVPLLRTEPKTGSTR